MMRRLIAVLVGLAAVSATMAQSWSEADLAHARSLRETALDSDLGYRIVTDLTTRIGPRLAGSPNDPRAVQWAVEMLRAQGFDRVWTEPVTFPAWSREYERVRVVAPVEHALVALAIGFSPATPEGGIEGEVVMLDDLAALEAVDPERVKGRIVFIRNRMQRARDGSGYGAAVAARSRGSQIAAQKGASALVIRSIGTSTNRFAHTGMMRFDFGSRRIPTVAVSNPDADLLERLVAGSQPVRLHIEVGAHIQESYTSHNVIAEITGAKAPEKIVALGAHLDSWDVGTGAIDDGAGVGIVTAAAHQILEGGRRPDRSIWVVLLAAEEIGLWGGRAFAERYRSRIEDFQLAAESDFGAGRIYALEAKVADKAWSAIETIAAELAPLGIELGGRTEARGGPDFFPLSAFGLAAADLRQDGTLYFDYHHTENDTLDKIDPGDLAQNVAAYAVLAWLAAQAPVDFGSGPALVPEQP